MRATFEAAILGILEADASLADRFATLTSILAPSNITAFALLIEMPALEARQAADLTLIARQSGRWTGRSFIRGGRAERPPGALHASPRRRTLQPRT